MRQDIYMLILYKSGGVSGINILHVYGRIDTPVLSA